MFGLKLIARSPQIVIDPVPKASLINEINTKTIVNPRAMPTASSTESSQLCFDANA